ncbi:alpha/beta hydrolase [Cryptosporangium aurantiacum]|uniref:Acetyl esterase n=1 Tax=Cryptosporangium aurantiacum TaxID=134849 RepID=A0A1M7Q8E4_9ACTN|nr:alpha/beta hydrolase [Cryptosporangium aurantiacum]SHN26819.1 acetyl esterase [Cryptosporangium aurantiacum]
MNLHPQAVADLASETIPPGPAPEPTLADIAAARAAENDNAPALGGPPAPVPIVVDLEADGVPIRLYNPRGGRGTPVMFYLHGGGWVGDSLITHDAACRRLAHRSHCAVVAIDYRLAPEYPWPAQVEDSVHALAWVRDHADELGLDVTRTAVVGDSAGGTLAAILARRARDAHAGFDFQALIYPPVEPFAEPPVGPDPQTGIEHGLSVAEMNWAWNTWLAGADPDNEDISPARIKDLAGLPPTLIITAEFDVLREGAEAYGEALAAAGVPVVTTRYLGVPHGFFRRLGVYDAARTAVDQVAIAVKDVLDPIAFPVSLS